MDIYRTSGIIGGALGVILLAIAWLNAPAVLGPLDPTIFGLARETALLAGIGLAMLAAGIASYMFAKPAV